VDTNSLIQKLAITSKPTRPLSNPWARMAVWLAISVPYILLVVLVISPRGDILEKLGNGRFLIEQFAALATGISAAVAAFASTMPGYNKRYLLLPVFPLSVWLGTLGVGCLLDFSHHGLNGTPFHADWFCIPGIVIVGAIPGLAIALMLKRGAPLTPTLSTALAGLAAAGIGDFGLRLFHPEDSGLVVLVWQFGTVFILSMLAGWSGRYFLNWRSRIAAENRRLAAH
jgi:hypothetical protein